MATCGPDLPYVQRGIDYQTHGKPRSFAAKLPADGSRGGSPGATTSGPAFVPPCRVVMIEANARSSRDANFPQQASPVSEIQENRETTRGNWPTTQISLLERIQNQEDTLRWDQFVGIYGPLVLRYCCRRGLQEADARDVVQDVLLQVSNGISEFRYDRERGQFRNWLGTLTHRAMLKHLKKSRRARTATDNAARQDPLIDECPQPLGEAWTEAFNAHVYRTALERIRPYFDEDTWRVFLATFAENQAPAIVATEMNRSIGWVYQAKSKVVRRLKEEVLYLAEDSALLNLPSTQASGE